MIRLARIVAFFLGAAAPLAHAAELPPHDLEAIPVIDGGVALEDVRFSAPRTGFAAAEIGVVVNTADPQSVAVADYYMNARQIPPENRIEVEFPSGQNEIAYEDFAPVREAIWEQTPAPVQGYAITWTQPWRVGGNCLSMTAAVSFGFASPNPCAKGQFKDYYQSITTRPYDDIGFRPSMMLAGRDEADEDGVLIKSGVDWVKTLIDRSVLADRSFPRGTGYFVRTADANRSLRWVDQLETVTEWNDPEGLNLVYLDRSSDPSFEFSGYDDVLFYFSGRQFDRGISANAYLPGSVADNMTSFNGNLVPKILPEGENPNLASHTSILRFFDDALQGGVSASYGPVIEPTTNLSRFSRASVFLPAYFGGATVMEAYWKSVEDAYLGNFIGDPLTRPYGIDARINDSNEIAVVATFLKPAQPYFIAAAPSDGGGPWEVLLDDIVVESPTVFEATLPLRRDSDYVMLLKRLINHIGPTQYFEGLPVELSVVEGGQLEFEIHAAEPLGREAVALDVRLENGDSLDAIGAQFEDAGDGTGLFRWTAPEIALEQGHFIEHALTLSASTLSGDWTQQAAASVKALRIKEHLDLASPSFEEPLYSIDEFEDVTLTFTESDAHLLIIYLSASVYGGADLLADLVFPVNAADPEGPYFYNPYILRSVPTDQTLYLRIYSTVETLEGTNDLKEIDREFRINRITELSPPDPFNASGGLFADKVEVLWSASTGASHYDLYRSVSDDSGTAQLLASNLTGTNYEDRSALNGVRYRYWIVAKRETLESVLLGPEIGYALKDGAAQTPVRQFGLGLPWDVVMSPDGGFIATCSGSNAYLWQVGDGERIRAIPHLSWVNALAFSPDGDSLLTGSRTEPVRLWNVADGSLIQTFEPAGWTDAVAFSADGALVAGGGKDGQVRVWNAADGNLVLTLNHGAWIQAAAIGPDGESLISGGADGSVILWSLLDGSLIRSFAGHSGAVHSVDFSPDGTRALTGGEDAEARLWEVQSGELSRTFVHSLAINSASFSPDGAELLTASDDGTAKLWDVNDGSEIFNYEPEAGRILKTQFEPGGNQVLIVGEDAAISLRTKSDGQVVQTFNGHTAGVLSSALSSDGTMLLTGHFDHAARLWNVGDGSLIRTFAGHAGPVNAVGFSPDDSMALTGSADQTAKLWTVADGSLIGTLTGHTQPINAVGFSPGGETVLTGGDDQTAMLWQVNDGSVVRTFDGHSGVVNAVAFISDGAELLTAGGSIGEGEIYLWNKDDGTQVRSFLGHEEPVHAIDFSPDGASILAGGEDQTAKLWSKEDATWIRRFEGHQGGVRGVAFSPDGMKALTGGEDGIANLWNAANGVLLQSFEGHAGSVRAVSYSSDGQHFVTGGTDGLALMWSYEDNNPPVISAFEDRVLFDGDDALFDFTVSDAETAPPDLTLTVESSNLELAPLEQISIVGESPDLTLVFTPIAGRCGAAVITVTVEDEDGAANSASFHLTVPCEDELLILAGRNTGVMETAVTIPISVRHFTGLSSVAFSVQWDSVNASFLGVEPLGLPGLTASHFDLSRTDEGMLGVDWNDAGSQVGGVSLEDGTILLGIELELTGEPDTQSSVNITDSPVPLEVVNHQSTPVTAYSQSGFLNIVPGLSISGRTRLSGGVDAPPVSDVTVALEGQNTIRTVQTDAQGGFVFEDVPAGGDYRLFARKIVDAPVNQNVSTLDILLIRTHITARNRLDSPYSLLAADVNRDDSASTLDILLIRRLILGAVNYYTQTDEVADDLFLCLPSNLQFTDETNPWPDLRNDRVYPTMSADAVDQDFIVLKLGDVDGE